MAINIAISGFGRIGRLVLRAIYEQDYKDIKVVAINCSSGDIENMLIYYVTIANMEDLMWTLKPQMILLL